MDATPLCDSDTSIERANRLIENVSGLRLDIRRTSDIRSLADRVAPNLGIDTLEAFCGWLVQVPTGIVQSVVEEISVKETYFFRAPRQFGVVAKKVALHAANVQAASGSGATPLRIWSAGCSTGEEPYSLAFTVLDAWPDATVADVSIMATDISTPALTVARAGEYAGVVRTGTVIADIDGPTLIDRYAPIGLAGRRAVVPEARRLVTFAKHSVVHDLMPRNQDIIFCRNLMIYLDLEQQPALIERLTAALRPGGLLFLGDAELLHVMRHELRPLDIGGTLVYQRTSNGGEG